MTLAAFRRLLSDGVLDPDRETVLFSTGDGLKTVDSVAEVVGRLRRRSPPPTGFSSTSGSSTDVVTRT